MQMNQENRDRLLSLIRVVKNALTRGPVTTLPLSGKVSDFYLDMKMIRAVAGGIAF